jgi:PAS domain S-box-containing protein
MSSDASPRSDGALFQETADDLYEHAPCGYLSTLPDGTIVRVNQTLIDWTQHTREALLSGAKFQSLLATGSKIYYETHYAPLLRMQGVANEIAFEMACADGRIMPVLANSRVRHDNDGTPLFNRITLFDATDRRRYERELLLARRKAEQIAKDKADLLTMLSHDIRNPLNAVMGVVQLLDHSNLDEAQHRFVRLLKSSSENMLKLLNHVLELSKVESGSFALVETPFSLRHIVDDVVSTYETTAREKGLELRAAIDDRVPPQVIGDPIAMRQVLTNLVGNALKFTERGGVALTVTTREHALDAVTVRVEVVDTGIGIEPDVVERIFNPYTQANYNTAMKFGGTGLGLAITRKLLALYGSTVHVTSVPGEGSRFFFNLRLAVPKAAL